jgi:hypothetical protein
MRGFYEELAFLQLILSSSPWVRSDKFVFSHSKNARPPVAFYEIFRVYILTFIPKGIE